jgi:hypothetical protein
MVRVAIVAASLPPLRRSGDARRTLPGAEAERLGSTAGR